MFSLNPLGLVLKLLSWTFRDLVFHKPFFESLTLKENESVVMVLLIVVSLLETLVYTLPKRNGVSFVN